MSEIKALEKLRNMHELGCGCDPETCVPCSIPSKVEKIADEIEAEIAERFIELPVDADGVPCKEGEILEWTGGKHEVMAVSEDCVWFDTDDFVIKLTCEEARNCRHVKPRTLEDVLQDVWKEALDYAKSDMWRNPDEVFAERADEIREMMGGGE